MKKYLLLSSFVLLLTACSTSTQNTGYGDDGLDPNEDPAFDGSVCEYKGVEYDVGEKYYDGCNWNVCQEDGTFVGTEMGCEEPGEPIYKQ